MLDSGTILAAFRARLRNTQDGNDSTYNVAKVLGAERAHVYHWMKGRPISDKYALKIGVFCNIDPRYLVACVEFEKAQDDETRQLWREMADLFNPGSGAVSRFIAGEDAAAPKLAAVAR